MDDARLVTLNALGAGEDYDRQPYFYTDQYDLGMEYVGHASGEDEAVIQGDPASGRFRVFWVHDGVVAAGMHVNDWDAIEEIRAQVGKPLPG